MMGFEYPSLIFSDSSGKIFDHPHLKLAGRSGDRFVHPDLSELLPLPRGSQLFTLPGRLPVGWDEQEGSFVTLKRVRMGGKQRACKAVAAFLPPGYVRTLLPAAQKKTDAPMLPLWAYSSVGWKKGRFWATGILIDSNPHWDPKFFGNDFLLKEKVRRSLERDPGNRLLRQLSRCALEYHCFAAKNVFFRRWECPLPTSPSCNYACIGCISLQPSECCPASMERIRFVPTVDEISVVALPHLEKAEDAIVSFGQGCEGEPLMQWQLLERAIRELRGKTDRGTINLNTNGSFPDRVSSLCDAGLDSLRVTLNSPHPKYYNRYHRPKRYTLRKAMDSLILAKEKGLYTSVNLLVFPGFTDRVAEISGLIQFIKKTDIDLIQMRNLNIDPDLYLGAMGKGEGIGMTRMFEILKNEFPGLQLGYFNRTKENFKLQISNCKN
jgi:pyruvate-formate lyase-activating enzyme